MKGLCHGCCTSNIETTIDTDGNPKCVNCIGVRPAHLRAQDESRKRYDLKTYGYYDSNMPNPIKTGGNPKLR